MSRAKERVGWMPNNSMVTATALLALSFSYAIQQNPAYRNLAEGLSGFSISRMFDDARAPRQKAAIIGRVTPAAPVETADQMNARLGAGIAAENQRLLDQEIALRQSPVHPMGGSEGEVASLRARLPASVRDISFNPETNRFSFGTDSLRRPVRQEVAVAVPTEEILEGRAQ